MHTMGKSGGDHILEKVFLLMQYPHIERKQKLFFSEMHTEDSLPNLAQLEERGASGNSMTYWVKDSTDFKHLRENFKNLRKSLQK